MRVLIINGPNMNLLGERDQKFYGTQTLEKINKIILNECDLNGWDVEFEQSNIEGKIIELLHIARISFDGVILNAGAYSHYSYAIRDAVEAIGIPVVEVHMSNIFARENFRQTSVLSAVCVGTISGFGAHSYILALNALANIIEI